MAVDVIRTKNTSTLEVKGQVEEGAEVWREGVFKMKASRGGEEGGGCPMQRVSTQRHGEESSSCGHSLRKSGQLV